MAEKEKPYKIVVGIFDTITKDIRDSIKTNCENSKPLGVGVYTDECCETSLYTHPLKPTIHRLQIAEGLNGVIFTFPVDSILPADIEREAAIAYQNYLEEIKQIEGLKKYKAGFVIGSFDLLHAGHIENINLASAMCKDLYVVVKTDERIFDRKKKQPVQNTTERAAVLMSLKQVKGVLFYDLDSNRRDVIQNVIAQYEEDHPGEILEEKDIVAIFGEDLKEKEEERKRRGDWGDVNIEITPRPADKMRTVSSSSYKRTMETNGGLASYEKRESESLIDETRAKANESREDDEQSK